jgi:HK97 gp10 family phage protein
MKITGTKEIQQALNRLPIELQRSAETAVLRAGAKPINKLARAKAPKQSGLLKKSIGINVKKVRGVTSARVGARKGWRVEVGEKEITVGKIIRKRKKVKVYKDPTKYSHLVEYGTSHSAAKPFIRPAVEQSGNQVIDAMAEGYDKYLGRVVNRIKSRR